MNILCDNISEWVHCGGLISLKTKPDPATLTCVLITYQRVGSLRWFDLFTDQARSNHTDLCIDNISENGFTAVV